MPKFLRCSECGAVIEITLKATPHLTEKVISVVFPHSCAENFKSLAELGILPDPVPAPKTGKFIQKLDELNRQSKKEFDPGDRRPNEHVKSSGAPKNLLEAVKQGNLGGGE
jgi:hypothetical protein